MIDTARSIAAVQLADGSIPWETGRHVDPWNHIEAAMGLAAAGMIEESRAAYEWLAESQNADGSWHSAYQNGAATDPALDTNYIAYVAVGAFHQWSLIGGGFAARMWPTVRAAIDFVVAHQRPDGTIPWHPGSDVVLLSGNCSIHHALHCAAALAGAVGQPRPRWRTAAHHLATAIRDRPELFLPKPHSMDWYYPVLTGVVGAEHLNRRWPEFVVPGLGVRCVHDQPWVTGGETAELALTLATHGDPARAAILMETLRRLRHDDGSHWTGYQYANDVLWPFERTTWTSGAVLLAHAAIAREPATLRTFTITHPDVTAPGRSPSW